MLYKSIAARFLPALTAVLWTGVFCAKSPRRPDGSLLQIAQEPSLNNETVPPPKMSSLWLDLNDDLLSCICQFYGPVRFNASDRNEIGKVLKVLTTLSRLFEHLKYVGTIEVGEVLAYYLLLSELSFVKKRYPEKLQWKLINWPLPKGNLTLSLLISTGNINQYTLNWLASYLPYISDKSARVAAVNYCLGACAEGSMYLDDEICRILISASEPRIVHKLKQIRISGLSALSLDRFNISIAGGLLHFADAKLGEELVDDLHKALAAIANTERFAKLWTNFICYPTTLWNSDSVQVIFERNVQEFRTIPFSDEQRTSLSVINKIKFGAVQEIKDMSEAERKALFDIFCGFHKYALVFHIWAREDVEKDGAWQQFANDPSNTSTLSKLAFGLEGFFQNHFDVDLVNDNRSDFCYFLNQFKYYPSSRKTLRFHELLLAKAKEHSETILALPRDHHCLFRGLVDFFIDQGDKEGLMALHGLVSPAITDGTLLRHLGEIEEDPGIISGCQLFGGRVDGVHPLRLLAKRFEAAKVLRKLDFSRLWANDVGGMLKTLGIEREKMDAALFSLSHGAAPWGHLAEVLREFQESARYLYSDIYSNRLPKYHALWFYLWKEHQEAFVEHVDVNIQRYYLPKERNTSRNGELYEVLMRNGARPTKPSCCNIS